MKNKTLLATLGLAAAMVFAMPSKAHAEVFVGVNIGRPVVVARPPVVYVAPRPYYRAYYPRPVVVVPAYAPPARFFYRGRRSASPYAYRPYYGPRYFRR
ncbi:MAG TPA: hypothetical protein VLK33_10825 [Terriglobales bacterium]|nr:hypothetical protein [Terriglobales bacterium]